ncbi:MAG: hypothetical protein E7200_02770 [Selenomonas ruminantium]|nr:hypothetical protein [Selenomonas ruminantium]
MPTNENVKTLLVIGNGFDLAHGLETRYTNFLDFINVKAGGTIAPPKDSAIHCCKNYRDSLATNDLTVSSLFDCLDSIGNIWIGYFNFLRINKSLEGREDWIDFEKEIEVVIKQIENLILKPYPSHESEEKMEMIMGGYLKQPSEVIAQEFVPRLNWDLKVLMLLLEQYLIGEEANLTVQRQPIIERLNVDSVISYNYTNTFQRLYDTNHNIPVHFIHGQLGEHNLVLGIGETLPDGLENQFTVCANFKKFFQRVKYRLGNQYKSTTKNKDNRIIPWQVVIYGHSLDPTDKDSLYWLMKRIDKQNGITEVSNATKIIIYYYNEDDYNQQIANAIQIIGKDELIDSVNCGRIVFKPIDNTK